jgi:VWFA-related protein
MLRFRLSGPRCPTVGLIGLILFSLFSRLEAQNQPSNQTPASTPEQPAFRLKVGSNLVVVRVVVRDAQGKPVEGLRKEDFRLLDQGKEQFIAQFDEEKSIAPSKAASTSTGKTSTVGPNPLTIQGRFLAWYFDDLNTSDSDMIRARDAGDHFLAANLQPNDRVGISTVERNVI